MGVSRLVDWLVKVNIIIIVSVLYCRLYLYEYDTGTNGSGMAGDCKLDEGAQGMYDGYMNFTR